MKIEKIHYIKSFFQFTFSFSISVMFDIHGNCMVRLLTISFCVFIVQCECKVLDQTYSKDKSNKRVFTHLMLIYENTIRNAICM